MCTDLRFLRKKIIVLRPVPAALFDVDFRMNLQRSERGYARSRAKIWTDSDGEAVLQRVTAPRRFVLLDSFAVFMKY